MLESISYVLDPILNAVMAFSFFPQVPLASSLLRSQKINTKAQRDWDSTEVKAGERPSQGSQDLLASKSVFLKSTPCTMLPILFPNMHCLGPMTCSLYFPIPHLLWFQTSISSTYVMNWLHEVLSNSKRVSFVLTTPNHTLLLGFPSLYSCPFLQLLRTDFHWSPNNMTDPYIPFALAQGSRGRCLPGGSQGCVPWKKRRNQTQHFTNSGCRLSLQHSWFFSHPGVHFLWVLYHIPNLYCSRSSVPSYSFIQLIFSWGIDMCKAHSPGLW